MPPPAGSAWRVVACRLFSALSLFALFAGDVGAEHLRFRSDDVRTARMQRLQAAFVEVPRITQNMAEDAQRGLVTADADMRFVANGSHGRRFMPGIRVVHLGYGRLFFRPAPEALISPEMGDVMFQGNKHILAMHMAFLSQALAREPTMPPFDVTFDTSDYCRDRTTALAHFVFHGEEGAQRVATNMVGSQMLQPADGQPLAPLLSWNARPECDVIEAPSGYDWIMPQQDFSNGSSWRADTHASPPWASRKPTLVWRGGILSWDGSRSRGLRLGLLHPDILDVKVPWNGHQQLTSNYENCLIYERNLQAAGVSFARGLNFTFEECGEVMGEFLSIEQQMGHRYVLDMDGAASTFRLKNLLLTGSVVFRVQSGAEQFFFRDLQPFVHYVPVDLATMEKDLPRKVRWAIEHDAEAQQIAANARAFAESHLRLEDAQWYLAQALKLYAAKLDFPVTVPAGFTPFCCEDISKKWTKGELPPFTLQKHCLEAVHDSTCAAPHASWFEQTLATAISDPAGPPILVPGASNVSSTSPDNLGVAGVAAQLQRGSILRRQAPRNRH